MTRLSLLPITSRLRRRLIGERTLHEIASESIEISPAEIGEQPTAYYLPGQLDKVRRNRDDRYQDLVVECARMKPREIRHEATRAYLLRDSILIDGMLHCGGGLIPKAKRSQFPMPALIRTFVEDAAIPSSVVGSQFFGHFIAEDCATALLASDFSDPLWVQCPVQQSVHVQRYLEIYGVSRISVKCAQFSRVWHFQDFAMNANKRLRLQTLRNRVRSMNGMRHGHGVFFRRRGGGQPRGFHNEREIEELLSKLDFEIIDVNRESVDQIVRRSRDSQVVIGVEGSALMHGLMAMSQGGSLLCIQPPYRFTGVLKDHADALGMKYGFIVGDGDDTSFTVGEAELLRTIELIS